MYFNVDVSNVKQRPKNIVLFNVEFENVSQRGNNAVETTISKWNKKNSFQIEYTELKVFTAIS